MICSAIMADSLRARTHRLRLCAVPDPDKIGIGIDPSRLGSASGLARRTLSSDNDVLGAAARVIGAGGDWMPEWPTIHT